MVLGVCVCVPVELFFADLSSLAVLLKVVWELLLLESLVLRFCGLAGEHNLESFRTIAIRLHSLTSFRVIIWLGKRLICEVEEIEKEPMG